LLPENIHNPFAKAIQDEYQEQTLEVDLVVLAMGLRPLNDLYETCLQEQAAPEIIQLGDAFQIGRVFEAVKAGSLVGRNL
jgi:hypothetical protein